jgi:SAM-dependent methyltransferase
MKGIKDPRYDLTGLEASNWLENYFLKNNDRKIHKWWHYFEVYEKHFSRFRNKSPKILEIGVWNGGSAKMWSEYFGPGTLVFGIDVDPRCSNLQEPGIKVYIGSQENPDFLQRVAREHGPFDIIIDDGGHTMNQQVVSIETLFPFLKGGGVYLCEDTHTSYWPEFGGGLNVPDSFTNYCKRLTDRVNSQYTDEFQEDCWSRTIWSMHFYDSIVVLDKRNRVESFHVVTGHREL